MQKIKKRLRSFTIFSLTITCFAVLIGQSSGEAESNSAKSTWEFFMECKFVFVAPAVDGCLWRKMPETQKYGYIMGYTRGFEEGGATAWTAATDDTQFPFKMFPPKVPYAISYEGLVEALDEFYSDYANKGVCLSFALPIIIGRIDGYCSDQEAKEKIQTARKLSLKIPKARPIGE